MKAARKYIKKCQNCGRKLVKNGQENGKQRWRCLTCGTARIHARADTTKRNQAKLRTRYLLSKQTGNEISKSRGISRSTFNRKYILRATDSPIKPPFRCADNHLTARPAIYLVADATSLNCEIVAIARTKDGGLNWSYARYESSDVWIRIFFSFNGVVALVSDGQKGIHKAARICYGEQLIMQRCHFHIKQNLRAKLTRNPKTEAGQDLATLATWLCRVKEYDHMALFVGTFYGLSEAYEGFLKERTYYRTESGKLRWNYTHRQVRSAYRQIADLIESDQIFAYITHPELQLPNTTNQIEGGLNARINELICAHRGLLPERQRELVNEFLWSKNVS